VACAKEGVSLTIYDARLQIGLTSALAGPHAGGIKCQVYFGAGSTIWSTYESANKCQVCLQDASSATAWGTRVEDGMGHSKDGVCPRDLRNPGYLDETTLRELGYHSTSDGSNRS
jgi:hypothetical protein